MVDTDMDAAERMHVFSFFFYTLIVRVTWTN